MEATYRWVLRLSGNSSDRVVSHLHAVSSILVVYCFVVVVLVPELINVAVNHRLTEIDEEESRDCWEDESNPVAWEPLVDHTVSLSWREFVPKSLVVRCVGKGRLFLDKTWNVHVDAAAHLWLNFKAFDHLDKLILFLSGGRVLRSNLPQVLIDIVVKSLHN